MDKEEKAIRALVDEWMRASMAGDVDTVLGLMSDDAVFQAVGQKPFGKKEFEASSRGANKDMKFEASHEVLEVKVLGDWAYMRNRLKMTVHPKGGAPVHRSGHTLTILKKQRDGRWVLTRDSNTMTTDPP